MKSTFAPLDEIIRREFLSIYHGVTGTFNTLPLVLKLQLREFSLSHPSRRLVDKLLFFLD
jgi:hypothetical protein